MKTKAWLIICVFAFIGTLLNGNAAGALLDSQSDDWMSSYYAFVSANGNNEAADDFNVIGSIDRVYVTGYMFNFPYQHFQGVWVRFYQYTAANTPGTLRASYYLRFDDPNLLYDPDGAGWFDIKLAVPFQASGKHFLSVQIVADWWKWNSATKRFAPMYTRSNSGSWSPLNQGLTFWLYGTVTGPGLITEIKPTTATRSGFIEILGTNFSDNGQVLIGGLPAAHSTWNSNRIVAYVPEGVLPGSPVVQVQTAGGISNGLPLTVTDRIADGRVLWRFRMDALYSMVRPARASDGTIYVIDVYGRLYALAPNGALKWIARNAGDKGLAVGPDGTIYTGSENDVKAFQPDGKLKWTFVQNPRAFILLGIGVGPDGNVYGVASSGMGVFSLTPQGTLRWTTPEQYNRPIVDYSEIVFGMNGGTCQMYFYANNHTRAIRCSDGAHVFYAAASQPVVSPLDKSIHVNGGAFSPSGQLLWQFSTGYGLSFPDVASDGTHYVTSGSLNVYALNPNGSEKWHAPLTDYTGTPDVDPGNTLLLLPGSNTLNYPGIIQGMSTTSQKVLWKITLPIEEPQIYNPWTAQYGFNHFVNMRAKFSADGGAAYLVTAIATGGLTTDRCFIYAISTGGSNPPPPPPPPGNILQVTKITLSARERNGVVTVNGTATILDQNNATVAGAVVKATWKHPGGQLLNQSATTDSKGLAKFSTTSGRGTYTLTIIDVAKSGYSFNKAGSVLSKSITK